MNIQRASIVGAYAAAAFSISQLVGWVAPAQAQTPIERGEYLVKTVAACGACHTPKGPQGDIPEKFLAGGWQIGGPNAPFTAFPPNLTPDPETGIGTWTDEQIITAVRGGITPEGETIGVPMPIELYRDISDQDMAAIVAYLRSIPAVRNEVPESDYRIPLPEHEAAPTSVPHPDSSDKVAYGEYMVKVAHCLECHTPEVGPHNIDYENQLGAGGREFRGPWGLSVSANLTPTPQMQHYTDEDIKTMITTGVRPNKTLLIGPMGIGYYKDITDEDLDAIVAYLRTLPPQ